MTRFPSFILRTSVAALCLGMLGSFGAQVRAEAVRDAHTEAELVAASRSVRPGSETLLAVRLTPEPGWHLYWKNPGDSGLAPDIRWTLPDGASAGEIRWPYPHRIVQEPLVSYGYEEEILLVVPVRVPEMAEGSFTAAAKVRWLACQAECIPGKADLTLTLPVSSDPPAVDPDQVERFARARAQWPIVSGGWKTEAAFSGGELRLRFAPSDAASGGVPAPAISGAYFFPDNPELIRHEAKQVVRKTSGGYELSVPLASAAPSAAGRVTGVLVSPGGWRGPDSEKALAVDAPVVASFGPAASDAAPASGLGLWTAVAFAFVGGLLLNLMPCVLPVLSLKVLHFVREASENPKRLFAHGLAFTAGVVASFWILAGTLLVLRAAGSQIGWGFQLQSPAFVAGLAVLFTLFALNLFGVFEFGASLGGAGQSLARRGGLSGSFFGGVFATVVATPCTAPFMGAALGFTLAQPAWTSLAVFTSLGLGMAAPYLALCAQPALLKHVPKPGEWMVTLKQFLGFPLLATSLWLAWVFGAQKGPDAAAALLAALLLVSLGVWLWSRSRRILPRLAAAAVVIAALALAWNAAHSQGVSVPPAPGVRTAGEPAPGRLAWEPYSDARLAELRAAGTPVFVDFTAAWCLTCKVNERLALDIPATADLFRRKGVAALQADWTSQDPEITAALARHGRHSVPLYVYYGPGAAEARVLPEILTPAAVREAIDV